jgi:hypothetical protein
MVGRLIDFNNGIRRTDKKIAKTSLILAGMNCSPIKGNSIVIEPIRAKFKKKRNVSSNGTENVNIE